MVQQTGDERMQDSSLKKFSFYQAMHEENRALLRDNINKRDLYKGQILMGDNKRCNGVPLVIKGSLRLFRISEKGREMTLYRIGEGEICILAAVCAMGDEEYDFLSEAESESIIASIPPDIFKSLMNTCDPFRSYVFNTLAQKLISSIDTIEMLLFVSIEERIQDYLKVHANEHGEVRTTHERMAVDLGSSREVITRQLKKMADSGMLTLRRGRIIIKDLL